MPQTPQICTPAESRGAQTQALQSWLAATYPATFNPDAPLPLKIGVHVDLLARHPDLDPATLRRALKRYCERRAYQLALAREGAVRLDLDGQPAGAVAEDQRRFAKSKLTTWKAKKSAKSAARARPDPVPAPTPAPTPPPPRALAGRPILRLKPKAGAVVTATITRSAKP
ncbi:MAG: ProQ/FinO family protein [Candidatus Competibacteraceae bacterium]|nr:ProQ/FinO family protein [Candidatus Competibacteraceae bacterium]